MQTPTPTKASVSACLDKFRQLYAFIMSGLLKSYVGNDPEAWWAEITRLNEFKTRFDEAHVLAVQNEEAHGLMTPEEQMELGNPSDILKQINNELVDFADGAYYHGRVAILKTFKIS